MNRYYPIFLDLKGRSCLVVGGGEVACRKVAALLEAGADICVVAFDAVRPLETLAEDDRIRLEKRGFAEPDIDGKHFVIAATDDRALNERISGACDEKGIICNVVDQPDLCSAIIPSVVKRGRLQIAVSTSGASPAMARRIRETLESRFGDEYASALHILAAVRDYVLNEGPFEKTNREIFEALVGSNLVELCKTGDFGSIRALLESVLGAQATEAVLERM